jgi:hypothetical protein
MPQPAPAKSSRSERTTTMSEWIEVTPAYGRDYTSAKAAKADWNKGLDFLDTVLHRYVSKPYADAHDLKVIIRYAKNLKVTGTK